MVGYWHHNTIMSICLSISLSICRVLLSTPLKGCSLEAGGQETHAIIAVLVRQQGERLLSSAGSC